jgi:hypothetical protein
MHKTTRRHNPEDLDLRHHRRENLKTCMKIKIKKKWNVAEINFGGM